MIIRKLLFLFDFAWFKQRGVATGLPRKKENLLDYAAILIITCCIGQDAFAKNTHIIPSPESDGAVSVPESVEEKRVVTASFLTVFDRDPANSNSSSLRLVQATETDFGIGDVAGVSGAHIPVAITLPADAAAPGRGYTFLMFRNVPEAIAFSAGFRLRNSWAVSLANAKQLSLISQESFQGRFSMEVFLYRSKEAPPLTRTMKVEIRADNAPAPAPAESATAAGSSPQIANTAAFSAEPSHSSLPPAISPVEEKAMLTNGWSLVSNGNLASARFIFQDLAAKGSRAGAFSLAQTFDPKFLKTLVVVGLQQANIEEARKWYRVAAERGDHNAQERLKSIQNE